MPTSEFCVVVLGWGWHFGRYSACAFTLHGLILPRIKCCPGQRLSWTQYLCGFTQRFKDCKDTVFGQVTTGPLPVLSILSPHSKPGKLFNWCTLFRLVATCSNETLRYKDHWRNFADCTVCAQTLRTASTAVEVTRCLTVLTNGCFALTTPLRVSKEEKWRRAVRSRSSEDCRRLLINFNRNATSFRQDGFNPDLAAPETITHIMAVEQKCLGLVSACRRISCRYEYRTFRLQGHKNNTLHTDRQTDRFLRFSNVSKVTKYSSAVDPIPAHRSTRYY